MQALHITGNNLTLDDVRQVVHERRTVLLQPEARTAVERARAVVEDLLANDRIAYAVNTGVGKLADLRISLDDIRELQVKLLRSHAAGVGEPLAEDVTRAMVLLRANSLSKGFSGVRPAVIDMLCEMLRRGRPSLHSRLRGSVGASGDLAPLAHLALILIAEGEATFHGKRMPAAEALQKADIKPLTLQAKEAISLINGTQGMLAIGLLTTLQAEILADTADVLGALTVDALKGTDAAFDKRIHQARPHPGQSLVADNVRRMLEGSLIRESHRECQKVQDAYSLRCIPQVHGAVRDTLAHCRGVFEIEMNSAVDNPLVFPEERKVGAPKRGVGSSLPGEVLSGGNFHGEPAGLCAGLAAGGIALEGEAGGHLGTPHRAAGKSGAQRGTAGVPGARRRPELGIHDGAGHGRRAGQRKQGTGAPRVGGFHHYVGQPGRLRFHGYDLSQQKAARRNQHTQCACHRSAGRRAGAGFPRAAADGQTRPGGARFYSLGISSHHRGPDIYSRFREGVCTHRHWKTGRSVALAAVSPSCCSAALQRRVKQHSLKPASAAGAPRRLEHCRETRVS